MLSGTEAQSARARPTQITERLRTELVRDKSTKTDVLKALGELTGLTPTVSPEPILTGAVGAALSALERVGNEMSTPVGETTRAE